MKINNIDVDKAKQFIERVKGDFSLAKKSKKIVGRWNFEAGKPQFEAKMEFPAVAKFFTQIRRHLWEEMV